MSELIPLLNAEEAKRSIAFYEKVLGAKVESEWAHEGRVRWARIALERGKLMLNATDFISSAERRRG